MASRITVKQLKNQIEQLNVASGFDPNPPYSTVGAYTLSQAYGGYALHKWTNEHGGISDMSGGHGTAREASDDITKLITKVTLSNL